MRPILWLAKRKARHLAKQARRERRALRDHQRQQLRGIRAAETRARGLRLFVAWSEGGKRTSRPRDAAEWRASLPQAA